MAKVQAEQVKELRERTGAGLLDCKKALLECDANIEQAIEFLRKKGLSAAAKKAGRIATEGLISSYIHMNQRIGVLLEVNCETDFVANTDDFKQLCADIAMQVAALNPDCVRREEMDQATIESERRVLREKALAEGKSEQIVDRIVDGQINKFYSDRVLLEQKFLYKPFYRTSHTSKGMYGSIFPNRNTYHIGKLNGKQNFVGADKINMPFKTCLKRHIKITCHLT